MSLSPEQLEIRKKGIGGSEIAAILGLHPFAGPLDIYLRKVEDWQSPPNSDMDRGTYLEQGIADWYAARHCDGRKLDHGVTLVHATRPIAMATPDFFDRFEPEQSRLVSIKAPRRAGDVWGETGGQQVAEYAVLQLQWEDAVASSGGLAIAPTSHLVALVEGDLRVYPIERDLELQAWMLDFAEQWWARHVVARVPPPLDGSDTGTAWLKKRFARDFKPAVPAGIDGEMLLLELQSAEEKAEQAEREAETLRQRLKERIGEASGIEGAAGRITWKANKNGVRSFRATFTNRET